MNSSNFPLFQTPLSGKTSTTTATQPHSTPQTGTTSALQPPYTLKTTMPTTSHAHACKHMRTRTCMHAYMYAHTRQHTNLRNPSKINLFQPSRNKTLDKMKRIWYTEGVNSETQTSSYIRQSKNKSL